MIPHRSYYIAYLSLSLYICVYMYMYGKVGIWRPPWNIKLTSVVDPEPKKIADIVKLPCASEMLRDSKL